MKCECWNGWRVLAWIPVYVDTGDGRPGGYQVGEEPVEGEPCTDCEQGHRIAAEVAIKTEEAAMAHEEHLDPYGW